MSLPVSMLFRRAESLRREQVETEARQMTAQEFILGSLLDKNSAKTLKKMQDRIDEFIQGKKSED